MSSQPESLQSPIELIETESAAYNTTLKKVISPTVAGSVCWEKTGRVSCMVR